MWLDTWSVYQIQHRLIHFPSYGSVKAFSAALCSSLNVLQVAEAAATPCFRAGASPPPPIHQSAHASPAELQKTTQVGVSKMHHRGFSLLPATLQGSAFRNLQLKELKAALTLRLLSLQPALRNPQWKIFFFLNPNDGKSSWDSFPPLTAVVLPLFIRWIFHQGD